MLGGRCDPRTARPWQIIMTIRIPTVKKHERERTARPLPHHRMVRREHVLDRTTATRAPVLTSDRRPQPSVL